RWNAARGGPERAASQSSSSACDTPRKAASLARPPCRNSHCWRIRAHISAHRGWWTIAMVAPLSKPRSDRVARTDISYLVRNYFVRSMTTASFRFPAELTRFLRPEHRAGRFSYACARVASLKNAIEALGVPHTEVGEVRVNG